MSHDDPAALEADEEIAILGLVEADTIGVVHAVNEGAATWFEVAREIVRLLGSEAEVEAITTEEAARPAPRPANSVLDTSKLRAILGADLPTWQDALARHLRTASSSSG